MLSICLGSRLSFWRFMVWMGFTFILFCLCTVIVFSFFGPNDIYRIFEHVLAQLFLWTHFLPDFLWVLVHNRFLSMVHEFLFQVIHFLAIISLHPLSLSLSQTPQYLVEFFFGCDFFVISIWKPNRPFHHLRAVLVFYEFIFHDWLAFFSFRWINPDHVIFRECASE